MATADQVVRAILQEIIVADSEQQLVASEAQDTIFAMNNWMQAQAALGIPLGYTLVSDLSDEVTVSGGALQGIIANVAMEIAPQFDAEITPALINKAKVGLDAMRKIARSIIPMVHPSTMPIGSGNEFEWDGGFGVFGGNRFYPGHDDNEILTEDNGSILLEDNTSDT